MGRVSTTLSCWALLLALAALARSVDAQDSLIGYDGLDLELFTPRQVVQAGGGGGGGSTTPLSSDTPKVESGSGAPGTENAASRGDHVHPARTIPKQPLSSFGTVGASGTCAKANSSRDGLAYGDCGSPRVLSNRDPLSAGSADPGNRSDVSRSDHVHPAARGTTVYVAKADPRNPVAGSIWLRNLKPFQVRTLDSDGSGWTTQFTFPVNALASATPAAASGSGVVGVSGDAARADHAHPAPTVAAYSSTITRLGGNNANGKAGTENAASRGDHVHRSSFGDADQLKAAGTANAGYENVSARIDHVHPGAAATVPYSSAKPAALGTAAAGTENAASRGDHVHPTNLPGLTGHGGNALFVNAAETGTEWKAVGGGGGSGGSAQQIVWQENKRIQLPTTCPTIAARPGTLFFDDIELAAGVYYFAAIGGFQRQTDFSDTGGAGVGLTLFMQKGSDAITNIDTGAGAGLNETGPRTAASRTLEADTYDFFVSPYFFGFTACSGHYIETTLTIFKQTVTAGGGGSSGPSIPNPTAAGASRYLRVNAAGAAYEVGTNLDDAVAALDSEAGDLEDLTRDLYRAPNSATPTWAANANATNAQIAYFVGTGSAPNITGLTFQTSTVPKPAPPGWATGFNIVRLASGQNRGNYRVRWVEPDTVTVIPGNQWSQIFPSAGAAAGSTYWLPFAGVFRGRVTSIVLDASSNANHIGQTDYHGDPVAVRQWAKDDTTKIPASKLPADELPAIPGDTATKQYALEPKTDGSGVEWSNDIFSALSTNAQDIGDALERVGHVDMPSDAEANKSALAAGQVWTIGSCKDTAGSRACTAGFAASAHGTQRHLVKFGTGAANATSASFAPVGRLTQHALISGTSYDEFVLTARHVAGNPTRTMIRSCRIPGIQGDWVANAANPVHLISESGNCSLVAPATGNLTVTWAAPLGGQKIAGDTWRLYGVDWR
ncbi:MAG: hypothetical protein OXI22_08035 [Defluviicoccus sp.]|nr:hypothetical protein [Defluviicoccus sp.]